MDNALALRIIKARSGHGWSQADLAEVSGVAAAQISRYEQGRNTPRPEVIAKLAKALAVSFEWLAYGKGDAEDGSEVPRYPDSQKLIEVLELDDELLEAVELLAKESGLTIEMTIKQALLARAHQLKTAAEASKSLKKKATKAASHPVKKNNPAAD